MNLIKNSIALAWKHVIIMCGITGLLLQLGFADGRMNLGTLNYFTTLSNLAVVIYFICDVIWFIRGKGRLGDAFHPAIKGAVTMSMTITGLVAFFLLRQTFAESGGIMHIALILLHDIVPVMTIADWLLFDTKGKTTKLSPFIWEVPALIYVTYAMIAAQFKEIGSITHSRYPYPFLDTDVLGLPKVAMTIIILIIFFLILGYIYVGIDHFLASKNKPINNQPQ